MKCPTVATLNTAKHYSLCRISVDKEGTVTPYCESVNYLLEWYAMNDTVAETDAYMMPCTQVWNKLRKEFADSLCNKSLQCQRVYDEYVLKGIIIHH